MKRRRDLTFEEREAARAHHEEVQRMVKEYFKTHAPDGGPLKRIPLPAFLVKRAEPSGMASEEQGGL